MALKAAIHVHPPELAPDSTIEVVFPTPMVSKEKIGQEEENSPVIVSPELQGTFVWVSTRSGHFRLTQSPKFASSYDFKLRSGLTDLTGKQLSTDTLDSVESARFQILDRHPRWYDEDAQNRQPKFLFEFNDNVNAVDAAKHIQFISEAVSDGLVSKVRHAIGKDFEQRNTEPQRTWAEQISKVKPLLRDDAVRLSAIVVEPSQPLPVGKWRLDVAESLSNSSGHNQLSKVYSVDLGEIHGFAVRSISAHTPFDALYYLNIHTNKHLLPPSEVAWKEDQITAFAQKMATLVSIEPAPAGDLQAKIDGRTLTLTGGFKANQKYKVKVSPKLTSGDGMSLNAEFLGEDTFMPNPPYIAAPSFIQGQMAKGAATYEFSVANVSQVRVRAKKLTGSELLKALDMYRAYRKAFYDNDKSKETYKTTSIDQYPGTQILDRVFPIQKPLDHSEILKLNWREILGVQPAGPIFLELEGTALSGVKEKGVVTQTLVQFTDIGLMQKSNGKESLVYVTSLETGKAISGVHLTMMERHSKQTAHGETDASGIAHVPGAVPTWVLAEKDGDCTVIECHGGDANIRVPWHISQAYKNVWEPQRRTFVFSDRPLYKPGDTAHFKAYTRLLVGDDLSLDPAPAKGRLIIRDPRYRAVVDREIQFKANGTWAEDIVLPTGPAGWYELNLTAPIATANGEESYGGGMSFRVDDYKPNTFEIKLDTKSIQWAKDRIRVPLKANYYMGKPLSVAKIQWSAYTTRQYQPPLLFKDYAFGDAPSWAHYAEDRDADGDYIIRDDSEKRDWFVNGDLLIAEDGTATLEMPMPLPDRAALPQVVHVSAEVTDVNEQTVSASEDFEVPGAQFIVGLKGPDFFATVGKAVNLEVLGIDPKGAAPGVPVKVDVKIERQQYHTLKIATAGGGTTTKDQVVLLEEYKQSHELKPATSGSAFHATIPFTPAHAGIYFVTAESLDPQGLKVLSRMPFYVVGGREFPWAMEDGSRMNLQPEKTDYKPGEEAVIVVKTPIAGTALVTVERNKIHSTFTTELTLENPVIRVPITDAEVPNIYVSVIVIRGSSGSPKKEKMPEYRVGYCALKVVSDAKELKVAVSSDKAEFKPAETVKVFATVTDAKNQPVSGADVTLYAVDEGVLSLMAHVTPNPSEFFHADFPLAIDSFTSYDGLLPEEVAARYRGNKGFVIGGGDGDWQPGNIRVRKNFIATPLWLASASTDAAGRVSASVTAPDNLTRYRLMAIAAHGADRFGSGEAAFAIHKPLMIDPAVPRFARIGDEVLVKGIVHNATKHSGKVEVSLQLDQGTSFIIEKRDFIPASFNVDAGGHLKAQKVVLDIEAGETAAAVFPVQFVALGNSKWKWITKSLDFPEAVNDATESTFDVKHPLPELREVRYVRIDGREPPTNLIEKINPALLESEGSLSVSVSNTRLYEARDALDYVLQYPYGCVEQTTSATMPWIALGKYESLFPAQLSAGKAKLAIQAGVNKVLQMTTDEGGLAYWPGGQEPTLWGSAYAGLMLLRARDQGASVPEETIHKLLEFLSKKLRGLEKEKDLNVITDCALALYTLAKAGKPEPAYQNLLFAKRDSLPEVTRLYLALSMCLSQAPDQQIKETLALKSVAPSFVIWDHWAGSGVNQALRLICYTHLGLSEEAEKLAVSLLQSRNDRGDWGNTYANAWTLTALTAYERSLKASGNPLLAKVIWDSKSPELNLTGPASTASVSFALNDKMAAKHLRIEVPVDRQIFGRIEAKSFPPAREFAGENKGYAISRSYEKLNIDGTTSGMDDLRVGDRVVVSLTIQIGGGDRYLAIDDPLPSVFEAINPEFRTMNATRESVKLPDGSQPWFCNHREIRSDRVLFFTDDAPTKGEFTLQYLARVIAEGKATAPPARIEAMYEPNRYGLTPTQQVHTLPGNGSKVAGK